MRVRPFYQFGALIFLVLLSSCYRDDRSLPQPNYPPNNSHEYIFDEEFDDDHNGWGFADGVNMAYGVVSNGTFKFDYNDNLAEAYYVRKYFGFNPNNDFSLESKLGSDNNMGILFGTDDAHNAYGYSFMVDYDGYYALYDEGGNGYGNQLAEVVSPQTGNFVNKNGDWNTLRLEQTGNRWIGYVNNVQVFNIPAQNIVGSGIGFTDVSQTQGEADYLEVHWYN